MDWQLGLFRFGLLACFVAAIFAATQFEIGQSVVAIWNQNPTSQELTAKDVAAVKRLAAYQSTEAKAKVVEYPSACYPSVKSFRGLTRDTAIANVRAFLMTISALFVTLFATVFLGLRMARESRV